MKWVEHKKIQLDNSQNENETRRKKAAQREVKEEKNIANCVGGM